MDIVLASSSARRIAYTSLHFDPSNSDTHPSISNMAVCISLEFLVWRLGPAGSCSACTSKSSQGPHLAHDSSWEKKKLTRPVGETMCKCFSQSTMCTPSVAACYEYSLQGWHALHSSTQLTATQMHPVTYAAALVLTAIHAY